MSTTTLESEALALPSPPDGVKWSELSLSVEDPEMGFERYSELVRSIGRLGRATRFWIGDLLLFGSERYGEVWAQVIALTGVSERSAKDYLYVASRVVPKRRRADLTWTHHVVVAPLEPDDQERMLAAAAARGLDASELRQVIRDEQALGRAGDRNRQVSRRDGEPTPLSGGEIVDVARNLLEASEFVSLVDRAAGGETHLGPQIAERLPRAARAIEDAGDTVRRAAETLVRPSLLDAALRVVESAVKQTGLVDPAYIVPAAALEVLAALVAETHASAARKEG